MSKKILSVALALIFVISTFAVSAFAISGVTYEEEGAGYTQTWALEATDNGDGTWTVDVLLTADYYVGAIQFVALNSNPAGAVLTNVEAGADLTEDYGADVQANLETGLVAIIPNPAEDASLGLDLDAGVVATLTYEVTAGATISIDGNDAKTKAKPDGKLIAVRMSEDVLTTGNMVYGQIVDATAATADLGSVSVATPVLSGKHDAIVIDTTKTCNGAYAGVIYGFTGKRFNSANYYNCTSSTSQLVVENGTVVVTAGSGGYGTGTTVALYDLSGNLVATYAIVLFGDVDGNGTFTTNDITVLKNNLSKITAKTPQFIAANLASNYTRLTTGDITELKNNLSTLDQAAIGAKHTYSN